MPCLFIQNIKSQDLVLKCQILLITSIKHLGGKAASQNMAQAIALAANEASSTAAVQAKADHSLCMASIPTARMTGPTNSF